MKQVLQPHRSLWWSLRHCVNWSSLLLWLIWPVTILSGIAIAILLLVSCTTTKVVEQHHHHTYQADTLAMQAAIDSHLSSWHEQMDSVVHHVFQQYSASWFSHDEEKEVTTETVTSWVDSLGRQMRQEQRTTERTLSREQQQREERLTQEFESRLQTALARQDSAWQAKFNEFLSHHEQTDSSSVHRDFVTADNRPWYKRWWDKLRFMIFGVGIGLAACLFFIRKIWKKG